MLYRPPSEARRAGTTVTTALLLAIATLIFSRREF